MKRNLHLIFTSLFLAFSLAALAQPTVLSVTSTTIDGTFKIGDPIDVRITFSAAVNVTGSPTLELETGTTDRTVSYASGSGTTVIVFTNYVVQAGDVSSDLNYTSTAALSLNAGTILATSDGTTPANLTLPALASPSAFAGSNAFVIDGVVPTVNTVSSSTADGTYKKDDVIAVTIQFSEAVTITGTPQLTLETGGTDRVVNYSSGSGTNTLTFNYTVQTNDQASDLDYTGTSSLALNSGMINDAAGNAAVLTLASPGAVGSLGNSKALVVDGSIPTVSSVSSTTANGSYKEGDVISITVLFSESVNVTGTPQITLETGGTDRVVNYTGGTGTSTLTFDYTVQAGDVSSDLDYTGTTALALNAGTIRDAALNNATLTLATPGASNSLGNNKAIVIDTSVPTVTSVSSSTSNGTYNLGDVIDITVVFSENVTVGGTPQITLETGSTDQVVDYSSGSGTNTLTFSYTIQTGDLSSDLDYTGTSALALNSGTIRDAALNNATLTLASPGASGSLGNNKALVVDGVVPTVTNVTSGATNGTFNLGDVIAITIQFSESVNVTGTPQLTLETGGTDQVVNYTSGTGTNTLTFNYTVQAGNTSADLDYVSTNALALNGGTVRDAALNDATLTLASPGAANSLGNNKALVIDGIVPTVVNVSSSTADGSYNNPDVIDITIEFSESVVVTGTPRITLETGTTDRNANYSSGSGSTTLTFNYTVQSGDNSLDLDYVATGSLGLNGGTIRDATTNDADLTLASPGASGSLGNNKNIVVDAVAPTVTNVTSSLANGSYTVGQVIDIQVVFSEVVSVTGTPQLTLETGGTDRVVDYTSGSGSNTLLFNYTVQSGDASSDLDYRNTTALALNSGTITDGATNAAVLTLASPGAATSLGNNKAIVIDTTVPTVSAVSSSTANGTYNLSDVIAITVQFSENVIVTGTPQLTLETGATDRVVNYSSGSGTNTLVFNYTVQAGDVSSDLDYTSTSALALNSGTIRDAALNNATLTLASPGASGSIANSKALVVDGVVPTVTNVTSSTANGIYNAGDAIVITVQFSENVTVTGTPQLTLETGSTDRVINYSSGSGTNTLTFNYTVQAGDASADLDYTGTTALALNGGTVRDGATNDATLTLTTPGTAGSLGANKALVIDTEAPSVTISRQTPLSSPTNATSVTFRATFSETVTGVGATDFVLNPANTATGTLGTVTPVSGLIYDIAVTSVVGETTSILNLDFDAGQNIVDLAGNPFALNISSEQEYVVDNTKPVLSPDEMSLNPNGLGAETITFTLSENITNGALTGFSSSTGSVASAVFTEGGTTNTVTLTNGGADGTWTTATTISYNSGTGNIVDLVGNTMNTITNHAVVQNIVNLSAGSIAFTSFKSDDPNFFSVVLLKDVIAGSTIKFTDNGWTAGGALRTTEQTFTWTADVTYFAGTEITFSGTSSGGNPGTVTPSVGTVSPSGVGGELLISASSGDQILAYQGPSTSPTFLAAIQFGGASWDADATSSQTSALPAGLTEGTNAIVGGNIDNGAYNVPGGEITAGSYTALRNNINGSGNWDTDNEPANVVFPTAGLTNYTLPPDLTGTPFSPANGGYVAGTLPNLTITYDASIFAGVSTGTDIQLFDVTAAAFVATWNLTDVNIVGATVTIPGGLALTNNHVYRVLVTPRIFVDADGNGNTAITGTTWQFTSDAVAPTVGSIVRTTPAAASTNSTSVVYTVNFSEPVNGLAVADFSLSTTGTVAATLASVSASSGTSVTVTINSISGNGTLQLNVNVPGATITDNAGNSLSIGFAGEIYTIDQLRPTVTSVVRTTPSAALTNATSVIYTVNFSENVSGIATDDFSLTTTGTVSGTIASVGAASGSSVTVTVNTISGDGTLKLNVPFAGATLTDNAGNTLNTAFTTGQVYTLDQTRPTVTSILRQTPASSPTNATSVTFNVTFSESINPATVAAADFTPTVTGSTVAGAISVTPQADPKVFFVTVPVTGDGSIRLDVLAAASINDLASNDINVDFTSGEVYTIDQTAPFVQNITNNATFINSWSSADFIMTPAYHGGQAEYTITFSEPVSNVGNPAISEIVQTGGSAAFPTPSFTFLGSAPVDALGAPATAPSMYWKVTYNVAGTGYMYIGYQNVGSAVTDPAGNIETTTATTFFGYEDGAPYDYFYYFTLPQPTGDPTFNAPVSTTTSITLTWNHAAGAQRATDYLIRAKEVRSPAINFPAFTNADDGILPTNDLDASDGILVQRVTSNAYPSGPVSQSLAFTGLKSGVSYDFEIYPFTYSPNVGINSSIDYKNNSPATVTGATSVAHQGTLQVNSAPTPIASFKNDVLNSVSVMQFTVFDDSNVAANWPADNAPFKFTELIVKQGTGNSTALNDWTQIITGAELTVGAITLTNPTIAANTITFSGIDALAPADPGYIADAGAAASSKTYTLKIWISDNLNSTLAATIDGLNLAFMVDRLSFDYDNADGQSSSEILDAHTPIQSGANPITVTATKLVYNSSGPTPTNTNPQTTIGVGTPFSASSQTQPKVYALDANNNLDLGFTASGTIDTPTPGPNLSPSITSQNFVGGILNLSALRLNAAGSNGNIRVQSAGVTPALSTNVTTVISALTQITNGGSTEPATISSLSTALTGAIAPQVNAVQNFDFTITDDAGANATTFVDNDGLPTRFNTLIIRQGPGNDAVLSNWNLVISQVYLTNGVTNFAGSLNLAGDEIIFSGIPTSVATDLGHIADGTAKTYGLKIILKGLSGNQVDASIRDLIDGKDFVFSISSNPTDIVTDAGPNSSSVLQSSNADSGNGNNTIDVNAVRIDFTTQWLAGADQNYDADLTPEPFAKAVDHNGNLDRGYTTDATIVTADPVTFPVNPSPATITPTNGIYDIGSLKVISAGGGTNGQITNLIMSSGVLTAGTSNNFVLKYSSSSNIIRNTGFSYPTDILYATTDNQVANITNATGVAVEEFIMQDGGGSSDADGTGTSLSSIVLNIENYQYLRKVALYDGATEIAELAVTAPNITVLTATNANITFSGITTFSTSDNGSKNLTVKVSFLQSSGVPNDILDNKVINFQVVSVTSGGVSSSFSPSGTSTVFPSLAADENALEVVATQLDFTTQPHPTNISTFTDIDNPYMVISARDAFANLDVDYTGVVGTTTNTCTGCPVGASLAMNALPSGNFVAGVFDFAIAAPVFQFTEDTGTGTVVLTVPVTGAVSENQLGDLPSDAVSNSFMVAASYESQIKTDNTFILADNINYINYQTTDITENDITDGDKSFELARLLLSDGDGDGVAGDIDGAATKISDLTLKITNHTHIRKIALFNSGTVPATQISTELDATDFTGAGEITFTGLNITAPDNGTATISLRVSFNNSSSTIIDNSLLQVSVLGATLSGGSKFYDNTINDGLTYIAGVAGGYIAPATKNFVEVNATRLDFITQPSAIEGILQPLSIEPVVEARDAFGVVDVDFTNEVATISSPALKTSVTRSFTDGILNFTGVQYDTAGIGTYLVEAAVLASNTNGSTSCTMVNVLHVSAVIADSPASGVLQTENIKGGSLNSVIFGVTLRPDHQTTTAPSLNGFTFSFNEAYKTTTETILKNFRVYESLNATFVGSQNITLTGASVTEASSTADSNLDLIVVDWGVNPPRDLFDASGNPVARTYFLQADVDVTASISTPSMIPQLIDAGYNTPTDTRIIVTEGSAMATVVGREYKFASTRPPVLLAAQSNPSNGQLNVDKNITQIDLEFDVLVWSLDGKAELYERASNRKVADLNAINGNYVTQGGGSAPTAKPLSFEIDFLDGESFKPDSLYYVTIAKGSFNNLNNTGTGISDNGFNFYGGISSNAILYFKISSEVPPALKNAQPYFANTTTGAFSTEFDQRGNAYYLVLETGSPAPDTAQISNPSSYPFPLLIKASDSYSITQINQLQTVAFGANLVASTTYDIWIYAKNDANPVPVGAAQPYGADYSIGSTGPTLQLTVPDTPTPTNIPSYTICPDSYYLLTEPIILGEASNTSFQLVGTEQDFNILAPSGYEFDGVTKPTVQLIGPDFSTDPPVVEFVNNTIINVKYSNTTANGLDNIIITNLFMYGAPGSVPSNINRFAGNANLDGVTKLASISTGVPTIQSFTNSYSAIDFTQYGFSSQQVITAIPDNYIDSDERIAGGVRLLPQITPANDYGPTSFTGDGVTNDVLSLSAVPKDAAFDITMIHTDLNGCVSETVVQYVVYDHTSPISEKLGEAENGTKQALVNLKFPQKADTVLFPNVVLPRIDSDDLAGYALIDLYATIPDNAGNQIIKGADWETQVSLLPISVNTVLNSNSPTGAYKDFQWDYNRILNASFQNAGITTNPYDEFKEFVGNDSYWTGGSLGKIQFVGRYQSTADFQVILPFIQEVELFVPPIPLILVDEATRPVASAAVYCENGDDIDVRGFPAASAGTSIGTFSLFDEATGIPYPADAFVDNGNGTATINPATLLANLPVGVNAYGSIGIRYTFQENNSPVSGVDTTYIRITPNPVADFSIESIVDNINVFANDAFCENKVIRFTSTSTIANSATFGITEYAWDFGDVNAGGSNPNTADTQVADHYFIEFNTYTVGLIATSEFGCQSPVTQKPVEVGAVPMVDFSFIGVSTNDDMEFDATNSMVSNNDGVDSLNWTFGDGAKQLNKLTTIHKYDTPGLYQVTARLVSEIGCTNELTKPLIVTEYYAPADGNGQYSEDFETNGGNWQFFAQTGSTSSWTTLSLDGSGSTPLTEHVGTVWKTHANAGKTFASERSALYSGTLDMRNWTRPILIFDSYHDLATGDGVVLEYSTDNLNVVDPNKEWILVGSIGTGVEWYNDLNLPGKPGNQSNNFYGWTRASEGWQTSRHSLANLVGEERVVIRFSLGSVSDPAEGYALDNVRIGNGTRTVLLENFTNTSPSGDDIAIVENENEEVNQFLDDSPVVDLEVVKVNYHVAFPGPDPFNQLNSDDPGARALYYGIATIPQARLDGSNSTTSSTLFSEWGQAQFDARVLDLANAEIEINIDRSNPEADSIRIDFTPSIDVAEPVILHVLVLERDILTSLNSGLGPITTNETSFDYVLRRMLPNAAGTKYITIQKDQQYSVALPWADGAAFAHATSDNMMVVVFLQNELTREVYQSAVARDLSDPKLITAVEQPGDLSFEAYPNPADQELFVKLPRPVKSTTPIRLYDQMGKVVIESILEKGEQTKQLIIDHFASGIYILKIDTPEGTLMKKVVISHRQ